MIYPHDECYIVEVLEKVETKEKQDKGLIISDDKTEKKKYDLYKAKIVSIDIHVRPDRLSCQLPLGTIVWFEQPTDKELEKVADTENVLISDYDVKYYDHS